ncbi:2-octaprenyl-6-methoxyphenyl hydroxylase [Legionella norrlandica]|uniref:2-octaprenyl-6-methoxyphenyl hydroxylase n=1 Tax=Legionella norrlandica TaxID=1498499 RepID=A0A0A2T6E2_9GAMM|nr:2-octaprenyl-6-methoxyphenyl hydroxylase [Legionella norrlandica]KGP62983.1 2-octaprenyl-6-methoxyphenyl hydroxylase [Legionella norrlandica]
MVNRELDILIIGGGLTGASLLLALQGLGFSIMLVESKPFSNKTNPDFDARSLALSPASQRILSMLGVWDILKEYATPIEMIHVSDQHRFGISRLYSEKNNPLGYVVEMQYINKALESLLNKEQLLAPATLKSIDFKNRVATIITESGDISIAAQLIVAADGTDSISRQLCNLPAKVKNYEQQGIVANVGLLKPHGNRAFERFTPNGPLALLPMQGNKMSLVWSLKPHDAQRLMVLKEDDFLRELQSAFGYRLGRFNKIGKRHSYPLKQVLMPQQSKWPVVFVGNAAHTLHPVAGQGFNLGLRDVAALAQCIAKNGLNPQMLEQYLKMRAHDQQMITWLTDGLIHLFTSRLPGIGVVRNLGLIALDNIPALKNILGRYARGFGGISPDLVCEMALSRGEYNEPTI